VLEFGITSILKSSNQKKWNRCTAVLNLKSDVLIAALIRIKFENVNKIIFIQTSDSMRLTVLNLVYVLFQSLSRKRMQAQGKYKAVISRHSKILNPSDSSEQL